MFQRYAVYYTPKGALAEKGAAWLGWDVARGIRVEHPHVAGLDVAALTHTPRKYGLHGTIKPPFYLTQGCALAQLHSGLEGLCSMLSPVVLDGLDLRLLDRFIALTPIGEQTVLAEMAAQVVTKLDHFRAAPSAAELARRRKRPLTPAQELNLANWGYPYVMGQFRFHITLTGQLEGEVSHIQEAIHAHFFTCLQQPFVVDSLTLAGQSADGMFHETHRYALTG
ncbi:DUF1045 domain-containing protein [Litoreibacter sp.]|nr:DUF1045 domain-containing protein [Litoreibacter sp.]